MVSSNISDCNITANAFAEQFKHLLPTGSAWIAMEDTNSTMYRYWLSIGTVFADYNNYVCSVVDELIPCLSNDLLSRHEAIYGLIGSGLTDSERRTALCVRQAQSQTNTCEAIQAIALSLGVVVKCIDNSDYPLACGNGSVCYQVGTYDYKAITIIVDWESTIASLPLCIERESSYIIGEAINRCVNSIELAENNFSEYLTGCDDLCKPVGVPLAGFKADMI